MEDKRRTNPNSSNREITFGIDPSSPATRSWFKENRKKLGYKINEGFEQKESSLMNNEEDEKLYKSFRKSWKTWKQRHQEFMQIEREFNQIDIRNFEQEKNKLLAKKEMNIPDFSEIFAAFQLRNQMIEKEMELERLFQESTAKITMVLKNNQNFNYQIKKNVGESGKINFFSCKCRHYSWTFYCYYFRNIFLVLKFLDLLIKLLKVCFPNWNSLAII
ncbi:MAG: hypothetical protein HC908_05975 [Calothrix sp. SM1_7_51]|nr:hypothetical protein [Calothrix sp. SM1_7_51]